MKHLHIRRVLCGSRDTNIVMTLTRVFIHGNSQNVNWRILVTMLVEEYYI